MEFDELSHRVIGCVPEIHREMGPGLSFWALRHSLQSHKADHTVRANDPSAAYRLLTILLGHNTKTPSQV